MNEVIQTYRPVVDSGLSIDELEAGIESLGSQAAQIELWNAEPGTPYWMRRRDAERVSKLRATQAELLSELATKKLRARDSLAGNLPRMDAGIAKPGMFRTWLEALAVIALGAAGWYAIYLVLLVVRP